MAEQIIITPSVNTWIDGCIEVAKSGDSSLVIGRSTDGVNNPDSDSFTFMKFLLNQFSSRDKLTRVRLKLKKTSVEGSLTVDLHKIHDGNDFDANLHWGQRLAGTPWISTHAQSGGSSSGCNYESGKFSPNSYNTGSSFTNGTSYGIISNISVPVSAGVYYHEDSGFTTYITNVIRGLESTTSDQYARFFIYPQVDAQSTTIESTFAGGSESPSLVIDYIDTTIAPNTISPTGDNTSTNPTYSWEDISADSYEIEIRDSDTLVTVHTSSGISATTYSSGPSLSRGKQYDWRIRGIFTGYGNTDWSDWETFDVDVVAPVFIGDVAAGTCQPDIVVRWNNISGVTQYNVTIEADINGDSGYAQMLLSDTNTSQGVVVTSQSDIQHRARIRAYDPDTGWGAWSNYYYFTTIGGAYVM